jgi:hypothetical protein
MGREVVDVNLGLLAIRAMCAADAAAPANGSSPKRRRRASPKKQDAVSPGADDVASPEVSGAPAPGSETDEAEDAGAAGGGSPKKAKKPVKKAVLKNTGLEAKVAGACGSSLVSTHCIFSLAAGRTAGTTARFRDFSHSHARPANGCWQVEGVGLGAVAAAAKHEAVDVSKLITWQHGSPVPFAFLAKVLDDTVLGCDRLPWELQSCVHSGISC